MASAIRVAILTISDSSSRGERANLGGPTVRERCLNLGWQVASEAVLPDELAKISSALKSIADSGAADLILTTGGTGLGPRDVTPEATAEICERIVPGLAEMMRERGRQATPRAALSRAVAGTRGNYADCEFAGKSEGRGGIAECDCGFIAARLRSNARRAARLKGTLRILAS